MSDRESIKMTPSVNTLNTLIWLLKIFRGGDYGRWEGDLGVSRFCSCLSGFFKYCFFFKLHILYGMLKLLFCLKSFSFDIAGFSHLVIEMDRLRLIISMVGRM